MNLKIPRKLIFFFQITFAVAIIHRGISKGRSCIRSRIGLFSYDPIHDVDCRFPVYLVVFVENDQNYGIVYVRLLLFICYCHSGFRIRLLRVSFLGFFPKRMVRTDFI